MYEQEATNPKLDAPKLWRPQTLTPPNFDGPKFWRPQKFDTPKLRRPQNLTPPNFDSPILWQPQIGATLKCNDLETRQPQNATTPKLPKKNGQKRASSDFYDFFPERQLNLLVFDPIDVPILKTGISQISIFWGSGFITSKHRSGQTDGPIWLSKASEGVSRS